MFREQISRNKFYLGPVEVKKSEVENAGVGVFATKDLEKNTLIERCSIIKFDRRILKLYREDRLHRHLLADYIFRWPGGRDIAIALGCGSLYNHHDSPNAMWRYCTTENHLADDIHVFASEINAIEFWTKKEIKSGEEIFTSYGETSEFGSKGLDPAAMLIYRQGSIKTAFDF